MAAEIVVTHVPVPEHPPLQPVKTAPVGAVAVSVTEVPESKDAEHVGPQLMPAGEEVTVPGAVPAFVIERAYEGGLNVALTCIAAVALAVNVQGPVPEQPLGVVPRSDQPAKVEPALGVAVSVIWAPTSR